MPPRCVEKGDVSVVQSLPNDGSSRERGLWTSGSESSCSMLLESSPFFILLSGAFWLFFAETLLLSAVYLFHLSKSDSSSLHTRTHIACSHL